MSLRSLPEAKTFTRPQNLSWDAPADVLAKWVESPMAAAESDDTISIFDVIGEDWWTGGGFTAKRTAAALRSIGNKNVKVQINSPGGDVFEGIAIYNLLRAHPAKVTVEIMGWAASAASIIAMAGDEIRMGPGTFLMIHNAWGVVVGNRHDLRTSADVLEGIDQGLVDIYAARASIDRKAIEKLMDAETFMGPTEAVDKGFADAQDDTLGGAEGTNNAADRLLMARRQTEAALARAGHNRSARADILREIGGGNPAPRDASRHEAPRDASFDIAALERLLSTTENLRS
jgi:ATP-dependent Clp protease protease subunit